MKTKKSTLLSLIAIPAFCFFASAQNPKIKVYFNHAVNTSVSSGTNAVYITGSISADTIAAYINRAKYTVDIAQYDYTSSSSSHVKIIATAINNASARGVVVRWIYDGSSSNTGLSFITWTTNVNKLASPVQSGYIMHNKFMVIDVNSPNPNDAFLWTGSYDWSDSQMMSDYNNMVIVQDQNVALAYYNEFNKMWGGTGATPVTANEKFSANK
ncbi:MAG TPA: phospholipase D-like domain-containing protein, partial [Bacteroidia bacterium]|nr:phospholipase D-like domain-containing protein [Bacteroidia bacterium]